MQCDAKTLCVTLPAQPDAVARARTRVSEFAASAGADQPHTEAVRLAVSEALTNAVLHAYRGGPGEVHVTAALVSGELWVLVCDDGCGLEVRTDRPGLGLGLALISQISEEMSVAPRAGGGTEVRMRFTLVGASTSAAPAAATAPSTSVVGAREAAPGLIGPQPTCGADRRARRPA